MKTAIIKTNFGNIKIELYENDAPKTVKNFLDLAEKGFYNNLIFHRVVKNFVIQGGDPFCNLTPAADAGICGAGGPGYQFEDELNANTESYKAGYKKGVVAMANSGPNTNGSQFFIMLADNPLPHNYTIFGKVEVIEGQKVVDKIGSLPISQNDRPLQPAIIKEIIIK
ncbi:MAG: peptidylprolyl isomerase [Candidatus Terrybacteria bacterium]|nr:peptidylprolyl isomerase [Candidatus Terrybacteria bacterium]